MPITDQELNRLYYAGKNRFHEYSVEELKLLAQDLISQNITMLGGPYRARGYSYSNMTSLNIFQMTTVLLRVLVQKIWNEGDKQRANEIILAALKQNPARKTEFAGLLKDMDGALTVTIDCNCKNESLLNLLLQTVTNVMIESNPDACSFSFEVK
ncbi:MAG: hypothetical protein ACM3KR_05580 [Deltaproteobacteria bacterium]